jgi:general nucleoside transport system ATP-binding protein
MAFLEARGISKRYGSVIANYDVSFSAERGQLTALLGENGAGKTTLARILAGEEAADSGSLYVDGKRTLPGIGGHQRKAIGLVHQHPRLVDDLSVSENVALGAEPLAGFLFLDRKAMLMRTVDAARDFGFSINPDALVRDLSPAERQEAEILRTLSRGSHAIILDEPTSLLAKEEAESLYRLLDRLVKAGKAIVIVTHRLSELSSRADRFVFLRDGHNSGECAAYDGDFAYRAMFGSASGEKAPDSGSRPIAPELGDRGPSLRAQGLGREALHFEARSGEILVFMALAGNGLESLEELLSGKLLSPKGRLTMAGEDIGDLSIGRRRRAGLAYLPSDRIQAGIDRKASIAENLLALDGASAFRFPGKSKREFASLAQAKLKVLSFDGDFSRPAGTMSGGQMQALIIDRELALPALAASGSCVLACMPTWGLDRRARLKAHDALRRATGRGSSVVALSSEIEEALELADRIIVLYRGRISLEADNSNDESLEDAIARAMIGERR